MTRAPTTSAPRFAYLLALCVSFAMAGATVVQFLRSGPTPMTTWLVPPLLSAIASLLFALKWPDGSWRWGVWLSSGFWIFFLAAFVSYLLAGKLDWLRVARAVSVLPAGIVTALLGERLRRMSTARH